MRDRYIRWTVLITIISLLIACSRSVSSFPPDSASTPSPAPSTVPSSAHQLEYSLHRLPNAIIHTLTIPADSQFVVTTAIAQQLQTVKEFAVSNHAIAALNSGFFDPQNQKSTASVILNAQPVAKPEDNERLMNNPELRPSLDKILNRSEFRRYECIVDKNVADKITWRYDITPRQALPPTGCQLQDAVGAGPQLLPVLTLEPEGFVVAHNGNIVRDSLAYSQPNARSAIGILDDGSIVLVMAAQQPNAPTNSGVSLPDLAQFMKKFGVEKALNLDGGSSSALFFQGETFYGKFNSDGQPINRRVKSVLLVKRDKPER